MNSFFIPQLGSQIYTMAGMMSQLSLQADEPGDYPRHVRQFSGEGLRRHAFRRPARFRPTITRNGSGRRNPTGRTLDRALYAELVKPSVNVAPQIFGAVEPKLFEAIVNGDRAASPPTAIRRPAAGPRRRRRRRPLMLGKLSWSAIPFDQPIPLFASLLVVAVVLAVLVWITVKGHWPYLWREWITSVDHKRIGVMYCVLALVMLIRGFIDAIMMRSQQALAFHSQGYLPPEHFDQIFSAHGTIMIFFVAMPFMIGLMNFAVPLQLGVRDVAFPTFNSVSLWLTASAVLLVNISLFIGEFAADRLAGLSAAV